MKYPPVLSEEALETLISDVKDWQITHGSLLKLVRTEDEHTVLSQPVGCTLFPTLFPRNLFQEALSLQAIYNKLYAAVAEDEEWLYETLKDLIDVDPLANALWSIYQEVKREGVLQNITLGIFRSDYMLHNDAQDTSNGLGLKQVEFNTVSCAGGVHGNRISEMHRHLYRTGMYQQHSDSTSGSPSTVPLDTSSLPRNSTLPMLVSGLKSAHDAYRPALSRGNSRKTCIIFIVQPYNFNIADERPIEYALWDESIANFRVTWGHEVLSQTSLTPSGELIYSPPERSISYEVSVVYFRAGFEVHEFNDIGHMARFQLEKSRAIKCPSLLSHLTTFKKVQQALALPNALDRFLNSEEAALVSKTFAPQYPLDTSAFGQHARKLATDPKTAKSFILKPSLEGGGHNFYGEDIVAFLKATPKEMWHQYVLMEKITPPLVKNFLMSSRGLYEGPVISELGVFRICLWERKTESGGKIKAEMLDVQEPCWSFKTKDASVNEMSVVKGYGCFDSPALVDSDVFLSLLERK
ncbi:glutathione synthase [Mollisia scopiformis]|uniref:Glutathione synthetase n=1 Tax=Mollisia scopiformis TaxID=149040 RepID=A0A194X836_MOLSC|nr:glutathione synthase [Mollisia scopiformis]KUJ15967.1 glutathione synthase [Mollisia scopiformis]